MADTDKSFSSRQRILMSRLAMWPIAVAVLFTESKWNTVPPVDGFFFLAGCLLVGIATMGRLWCSLYICGRKTYELVTSGPYSMCRNPLYLFSAIGVLGIGLTTETFTVPAVFIVLFAVLYPAVISREEGKLRKVHGERYDECVSKAPRFFPSFAHFNEPEDYDVAPIRFRSALFDALWFVWLIGIMELAESLREAGIMPVLLRLY